MNCLYCHQVHSSAGELERNWCTFQWSECRGQCSGAQPYDDLDAIGANRLICRLVEAAIEAAQHGHYSQVNVAFDWAVIGGLEPHAAARAITVAISSGRVDARRERRRHLRTQREAERLALYSEGNTCPFCGATITDAARACKRHARREL